MSAVFAALHGMFKAEVGVSIQHDANHGAFGKSRGFLHAMQLTLDAVGRALHSSASQLNLSRS